MTDRLTIVVAARDAGATIERALRSCAAEAACTLVLIDDHSTDDTVERARAAVGSRLRVLRAPDPGGVSVARQCGLEAVDTELATWLDADDEWMPGRGERLVAMLDAGHDVAVDAFDLHDGATGRWLRRLTAPSFLHGPGGALRLFERNWLPGDSPVGFRVSVFRDAGGYDPSVYGPESYDLLLRALVRGATFAWSGEVGYRIYAYAGSVSRNLPRQRAALAAALRKHAYEDVRGLFARAGYASRIGAWALVSVALFRNEPEAALRFIEEACPPHADPNQILEPEGPWPFREGWRRAFARGVGLLLVGERDDEALEALRQAETIQPTAEGANNFGVALARLRRLSEAREWWAIAAARFPGYADARFNASADTPDRVTTHPLRRLASRIDYSA
jgi:glycosyltransferase involved in cell wall biosynthesis